MAKNIIQMQLLTYQTNINTKKKNNNNNNNKQTNKNKISSSFFNFPNSFRHKTKSWFERYYNIKKIYLKKLLKLPI